MRHARFVEYRSKWLVAVPSVEFEGCQLRAQHDSARLVAPGLSLELFQKFGAGSEAAVRLKDGHSPYFRPPASLLRRRLGEHHQSAGPNGMATFQREHVVGA